MSKENTPVEQNKIVVGMGLVMLALYQTPRRKAQKKQAIDLLANELTFEYFGGSKLREGKAEIIAYAYYVVKWLELGKTVAEILNMSFEEFKAVPYWGTEDEEE